MRLNFQVKDWTFHPGCVHYVFNSVCYTSVNALTFVVVLDAIIVGMDMLIKKFGETMKGKKRLCLITNAQYPIKDSFEGSKEDQVSTIAKQITAHGMRMECIIVRGKHSHAVNKEIVDENDNLLRIFSKETDTRMLYVEDSISLFGALRARNISLVTVYRGDLEVSPKLRIKVRSFEHCKFLCYKLTVFGN